MPLKMPLKGIKQEDDKSWQQQGMPSRPPAPDEMPEEGGAAAGPEHDQYNPYLQQYNQEGFKEEPQ